MWCGLSRSTLLSGTVIFRVGALPIVGRMFTLAIDAFGRGCGGLLAVSGVVATSTFDALFLQAAELCLMSKLLAAEALEGA